MMTVTDSTGFNLNSNRKANRLLTKSHCLCFSHVMHCNSYACVLFKKQFQRCCVLMMKNTIFIKIIVLFKNILFPKQL